MLPAMQNPYRAFRGVTDPFARRDAWAVGLGILATLLVSHLLRLLDSATVGRDVSTIVALTHGDHPWSDVLHRLMAAVLGIGLAAALLRTLRPIGMSKRRAP